MNELRDVARWGTPADAVSLSSGVRDLLSAALGVTDPRPAAATADLPAGTLSETVLKELRSVCPTVATDDEARLAHAAGKSTDDLLRLRAGQAGDAPDAVARPTAQQQVADLLAVCSRLRVAVVPFGGGTSVVGGLAARREGFAGVLAVDLAALDRLVHLDQVSRTATFEAGVRAPRAEQLLAAEGFTLGHFPQSFEYASLGGFAATRSSGQASAGYGRFDRMVVGLRAATPIGLLDTGRAPESAAGPDLRQLLLGSEGAFGVITELTVRVRPAPQARHYAGWSFPSFDAGAHAVRALAQDGPMPTVLRLSDETETAINAATGGPQADGCLAVVGVEGTVEDVAGRTAALEQRLAELGGTPLGTGPGEAWQEGRFRAPYLRDALLDAGAIAETLETATFWDRLPATYAAVRGALMENLSGAGTPPLVLCHISHVYDSGASLYFTVVAAQAEEPVAQWQAAKAAASDAIAASGATITHHHGVGRAHRPWYTREIGDVGVAALQGVKQALDPHGILNPGILLP
ncbi:alkyldihydroxyacetonephosphate synthase [Actinoplanes campanulatus]|uniref:Alkyldihydroxyacetonephosphate synthase n=1 Tax=Actinoplanes campanulatus TaxID=113559 RepID=A0A7W5AG14_9ACTN|nr:FAD-binding oxidoreductase [Actinoplanes campanulatus]MBB3095390.1 alkyldihydroxyacetonephosphate synthase [Actinoplanes campanulatus]GGN41848.1 alkyldihydroxyacetonephosphate synthase [Actinoplanes campanulatus]GID34994.1 alkyldihydroxyacetonephosphate synthase [Actinoplanes campanulatus]